MCESFTLTTADLFGHGIYDLHEQAGMAMDLLLPVWGLEHSFGMNPHMVQGSTLQQGHMMHVSQQQQVQAILITDAGPQGISTGLLQHG